MWYFMLQSSFDQISFMFKNTENQYTIDALGFIYTLW